MKEFDIELETIKHEINQGNANILESSYCHAFDEYVSSHYPWVPMTGYRIDWSKVDSPYKRLKWNEASEEETIAFFKNTCLQAFKEIGIIYGSDEPGLLVKFNDYTCQNLWRFLPPGFGTRFLVGIKRNAYGKIELIHDCFVEVDMDLSEWLTSSK